MNSAKVDGGIVKVGDVVGFKSDYEQRGTIVGIETNHVGNPVLVLKSNREEASTGSLFLIS